MWVQRHVATLGRWRSEAKRGGGGLCRLRRLSAVFVALGAYTLCLFSSRLGVTLAAVRPFEGLEHACLVLNSKPLLFEMPSAPSPWLGAR
ncbi:hypothetical protein PsYK624_098590 [Phanerochaete sordida]|uniref:Uncharacterized protein n=1 Tax=Phanerochaete sordida TaxID=48140 RepID=A0A9P3GF10_9APHY|nr:hypothetical protein PsYK624_098590 [Phanerochaete sordida]